MANKIYDAFDGIKADSGVKEHTKQVLSTRRNKKTTLFYRRAVRRTLGIICAMLVLAVGIGGYSLAHTPVSYVSIDVNPSMELALNRFGTVVSATAYNEEGNRILESLTLKGKNYTEAIDDIVKCEAMKPFLENNSEIVFTVAAPSDQEDKLKSGVEKCSSYISSNSRYSRADLEAVQQAHECVLSLGKYNAYLQLSEFDDTITPEDCRHMSMSEIHCLVKEHEQEESCSDEKQGDIDRDDHQDKTRRHQERHHGGAHQ